MKANMIPDNHGCGTRLWRVNVFGTGECDDLCLRVEGYGVGLSTEKRSNIADMGDLENRLRRGSPGDRESKSSRVLFNIGRMKEDKVRALHSNRER
jgi:hypothetical protein